MMPNAQLNWKSKGEGAITCLETKTDYRLRAASIFDRYTGLYTIKYLSKLSRLIKVLLLIQLTWTARIGFTT